MEGGYSIKKYHSLMIYGVKSRIYYSHFPQYICGSIPFLSLVMCHIEKPLILIAFNFFRNMIGITFLLPSKIPKVTQ